jgi:hypothetical protein
MDDETAFLELVKSNRQSELSALEEGKHAADSGMDLKAYAVEVDKPRQTLQHKLYAYRVRQTVPEIGHEVVSPRWNQLAEIHVAEWLRRALALRMLAASWTVETARSNAGRLKDVPEPPTWADRDAIAEDLAAGEMKPGDVAAMVAAAKSAEERIAKLVGVTAAQVTFDGGAAEVYEAVVTQVTPRTTSRPRAQGAATASTPRLFSARLAPARAGSRP